MARRTFPWCRSCSTTEGARIADSPNSRTTLGYGDIQALGAPAGLLAASDAVIGVFFIALAVARVTNLLHDRELGL